MMRMGERGDFTLPGEAGYEKLTLELAEKWGADAVRDSDGTVLSEEIMQAGFDIYSTICIIRDHNVWALEHPGNLQQCFLISKPVPAIEKTVEIHILEGYFEEQFQINDSPASLRYWEVYDRTAEKKIPAENWTYDPRTGNVEILDVVPFHTYTVNFLAYRIWEEISMYNHITNDWDKEHLVPVDPRKPEVQEYLYHWLEDWCIAHPNTTIVRFTSLFYNFVWIWGCDERNRNLYTDWASYDFTVSPEALDEFEKKYGYALTSEDFINQGKLHVTHMPADSKKKDYMAFINIFVRDYGKRLIELVHRYGKKAYVFYDDSWVGLEPYSDLFDSFGFDGLIKCVFSGFEARLCAGVKAATHELRLHPYLFPVGLGGLATFSEGGDPKADARRYWINIRRALLRQPVDRLGLGGYLHLTENFPEFCDYIEDLLKEFRTIKRLHQSGGVYTIPCRAAVLHSWGKLRSWTLSGHFHETYMHTLIHINEALSGLPVDVRFISFEDIKKGALKDIDIVINAGKAGTAWSGGDEWKDPGIVELLQKWVYEGGTFLGVEEPSAVEGFHDYFRMAQVLGIDKDTGAKVCHGKWKYEMDADLCEKLIPAGATVRGDKSLYLTDGSAKVLAEKDGAPAMTVHAYGKGKGIYLADFKYNNANVRFLLNILLYAKGLLGKQLYVPDDLNVECAYYPEERALMVINNSEQDIQTKISTEAGVKTVSLPQYTSKLLYI